ncbi:MAG: class I SAM-dependent methyltransferase [Candidatus Paceibacterota bacterium]|jgi:SAM-dependent methyltransferase
MKLLKKILIKTIKLINWLGSGISIRLVKWTGKSSQYIHPKHLIDDYPEWLKYFNKEDEVLDIGCDNGQRDFKLSPLVKKIIAFDYEGKAINQAKEWQEKYSFGNIDFSCLSAENSLPFLDNQFDKILFLDVLEHLNNRAQIMKECFRVLKPKGAMVLAIPNSQTPWKEFQKSARVNFYSDSDHKIEYSKEEIIKEHQKTGFKIKEINPIVYDFPLTGLIDLVGGINLSLYKKLWRWKHKKVENNPNASIGFMVISEK